jgi:hypothetical protein
VKDPNEAREERNRGEDAAGRERRGHAEDVRSEAEDRVQAAAAEQHAGHLAGHAAETTRVRELAESEQAEAAERRAERRLGEEGQELAEQERVDAGRAAETQAHKDADEARHQVPRSRETG